MFIALTCSFQKEQYKIILIASRVIQDILTISVKKKESTNTP